MQLFLMTLALTVALLSASASGQRGRRGRGKRPSGGGGGGRPKAPRPSGPRFPRCDPSDSYYIVVQQDCGQLGACPDVLNGTVAELNAARPESLSCTNILLDPQANVS